MSETIITVQGQHSAWYPAERATVNVTIAFDGPQREPVFESATASLEAVRETLEALHDPSAGPVTWWSADAVGVWSQRPRNQDGVQLEPVHYAALALKAKFKDFDALGRWIEAVVAIPGANVGAVEWTLTESRQTSVIAEVRSRAVQDAVAKATVYAQSIGRGSVTATALADPGMLGDSGSAARSEMGWMSAAKMGGGSDDGVPLALRPEDIEVTASVDARFVAR